MDTVVFDLGRVLLDWDPRYVYRRHFAGDEAAMERFLSEVVSGDWIREMDSGKPAAQAIEERQRLYPEHAHLIALIRDAWHEMLPGEIPGTVEILAAVRERGHRLFALTNFSAETWPIALERFPFLDWFEHVVVSGEVKVSKPDPRIYEIAIEQCGLEPSRTVFIDDLEANIAAARAFGIHGIRFTDPAALRAELEALGLL